MTQTPIQPLSHDLEAELDKKRKNRRIIFGIIAGAIILLIVGCLLVVSFAKNLAGSTRDANLVLSDFFQSMSEKDIDLAYSLMSEIGKKSTSKDDLQDLVDGVNFVLFDGFDSFRVTSVHQRATTNWGNYLEIKGYVNFEMEFAGNFSAILHKEDGEWKVSSINVIVPPEKMQYFMEEHGN